MSIDAVVAPAIKPAIVVLAIISMIVYYWIETTYGVCTSDTTENQSMLILELSRYQLIYTNKTYSSKYKSLKIPTR